MANRGGSGLRWSSGAASVALHGLVLALLLYLGSLSVQAPPRAPPLVATFLPEPEPPPPDATVVEVRRGVAAERPASGNTAPAVETATARQADLPAMSHRPAPTAAAPPAGDGDGPGAGRAGTGDGGAGTGDAGSGTGGSGDGVALAPAEWIERLSQAQMRPFFPLRAVQFRASGTASLACQVDAGNRARRCHIVGERPAGFGFGAAAMRISHLFRIRPPLRDGQPQYDAWVRVSIDFVP